MHEDLPLTKLRMLCVWGFDHSWKLALQMWSQDLWTTTQYVLKRGDYYEKQYTSHLSQIFVHEVVNKSTLLCDCIICRVLNMPEEGHSKLVNLECHCWTVKACVGLKWSIFFKFMYCDSDVSVSHFVTPTPLQCFVRLLLLLSTQLLVMLQ